MIGFARTMTGLTEFTVIALVIVLIMWAAVSVSILLQDNADNDELRHIVNIIAGILTALIVINFIISAVLMSTANRTPRQDVDRSEIYQQMESNKSGSK
jgi:mannitol-specific phosphotransferase system IIBC component